ncbi:MAG: hypothetical protein FWF00_07360 [Endomicrobia bacterium]|nr:hypothetical protein [Endomicrobiia bacterium]MCL2507484.1 hypothetical protein [Endomicrobiia bacterium]
MKKALIILTVLLFFTGISLANSVRYIVFFAESSDISQSVIEKILESKRFCISIPVNPSEPLPEKLEELVFWGKAEPSLVFDPEPVLPLLANVYSGGPSKAGKNTAFSDYVTGNINSFEENINREKFGVFLNSGIVSHNILYYFESLKLPWVNVSNAQESFKGIYNISGMNAFSIHTDFPNDKRNVMKWLESKTEPIIPVMLSKRQLNNLDLMSYLTDLFDQSKFIKPAVPLYITIVRKDLISVNNSISFEQPSVNNNVMSKLFTAASLINDYKDSKDFNEYSYKGAQSELVYLSSADLLKGVSQSKVTNLRMFDAAYSNIFRLLGSTQSFQVQPDIAEKIDLQPVSEETFRSNVKEILGGISITNSGILQGVDITAADGSVNISLIFNDGGWDSKIEYIDMYIDMNNIDGAGSTSMLPDTKGFLTPDSGWEYAIRIFSDKALLYRHTNEGPSLIAEILVHDASFSIEQKHIRGNPVNWGFQFICVSDSGKIIDFLNQSTQSDASILAVKPFQIHAVRLKK